MQIDSLCLCELCMDSYDIILLNIGVDMKDNNRINEIVEQLQGLSNDAELTTTLINELLEKQVSLVAEAAYNMAIENLSKAVKSAVAV